MAEYEKFIQGYGSERSRDLVAIKTICEQMMLVAVQQIKKIALCTKHDGKSVKNKSQDYSKPNNQMSIY